MTPSQLPQLESCNALIGRLVSEAGQAGYRYLPSVTIHLSCTFHFHSHFHLLLSSILSSLPIFLHLRHLQDTQLQSFRLILFPPYKRLTFGRLRHHQLPVQHGNQRCCRHGRYAHHHQACYRGFQPQVPAAAQGSERSRLLGKGTIISDRHPPVQRRAERRMAIVHSGTCVLTVVDSFVPSFRFQRIRLSSSSATRIALQATSSWIPKTHPPTSSSSVPPRQN